MWSEQKSGTRGAAECVTDVLTTFWRPLWSITERTATWNLFVLYDKELKKKFNDDVIYTSVLQ